MNPKMPDPKFFILRYRSAQRAQRVGMLMDLDARVLAYYTRDLERRSTIYDVDTTIRAIGVLLGIIVSIVMFGYSLSEGGDPVWATVLQWLATVFQVGLLVVVTKDAWTYLESLCASLRARRIHRALLMERDRRIRAGAAVDVESRYHDEDWEATE
jgi:hypothetical protein